MKAVQEIGGSRMAPLWGSCRLNVVIMTFFAMFHMMILRFNMSTAIVCTLKPITNNETNRMDYSEMEVFDWSKEERGYVLSSFFWGYICTQIIGGWLSDRAGGRKGSLVAIAIMAVTTLLIPVCARTSIYLVILVRVLQGLTSGIAIPSIYGLFAQWSHPNERATMMGIAFAAIPGSCAVTYPLSSLLCQSGIDGGWPMIFYAQGASALILAFAFAYLVYDSPESHPRISQEERVYLVNHHAKVSLDKKLSVPWKSILTSGPVFAVLVTHVCSAWGWYLAAINMPLFIYEVYNVDIVTNGLYTSIPFIGMVFLCSTGKIFDYFRQRDVVSLLTLRRIFNTIGFLIPMMSLFSLAFTPDNENYAVPLIVMSLGLAFHQERENAPNYNYINRQTLNEVSILQIAITGGFYFSHKDIGGPFSTMLFGYTQTAAQIPGLLQPLLVTWLTENGTYENWYSLFYLAGVVYAIGMVTYLFFSDAKPQPWAKPAEEYTSQEDDAEKRLTG